MDNDFLLFLEETGLTLADVDNAIKHLPTPLPADPREHYYIGQSDIHGKGVMANAAVDGFVGVMWSDEEWYEAGRYINHSPTPNGRPLLTEGVMILIATADQDEEITVDYRDVREILSEV